MKKKDLVPLSKTCEKLRDLGYVQDTQFVWVLSGVFWWGPYTYNDHCIKSREKLSAPTASEIGGNVVLLNNDLNISHDNEAECRALLLIWLIENGHINLKEPQSKSHA